MNELITDIPFKDYLEIDAVNNSYLGKLKHCPASALLEDEDTQALGFGRALHTYVLEGEEVFNKQFAVLPKLNLRTNKDKAIKAEFQEANAGKELVKLEDMEAIKLMKVAIMQHPVAKGILEQSYKREVTMTSIDPETGLKLKGRLDILPPLEKRALADLKSTADASLKGFRNSVFKYGYHRQGALYLDIANACVPVEKEDKDSYTEEIDVAFDAFLFIAVEKNAPYRVEVYSLGENIIELGRAEYKDFLKLHLDCVKTGKYPNYTTDEVVEIEINQ